MPADALDPSDPPAREIVYPTERQRALRATLLGAALGAVLAMMAGRRAAARARYSR
jgi:hypothetical protein